MNNTFFLTENEQVRNKNINPYTHLKEIIPTELFAHASYPYFTYYSKKVTIETIKDGTPLKEIPKQLSEDEVCISFADNALSCIFLNKFKNYGNKLYYLDKNVATKDTERTWKILEDAIDFKKINKVYFLCPHFTKIVYGYRIHTIYGKEVVDITY